MHRLYQSPAKAYAKIERGMEHFFTVDEFARQLGVTKRAAYSAVQRGRVRALRLPGRILVDRDSANEYLAQRVNARWERERDKHL